VPILGTYQSLALSFANLRTLHQRPVASLIAVVGFAGVTVLLVGLLAIRQGALAMFASSGRDNVAIVRAGESRWEAMSTLSENLALAVERMKGVARSDAGPLVSREQVAGGLIRLFPNERRRGLTTVTGRGVSSMAPLMRDQFRFLSGRFFASGLHEAVVGRALAEQFGVKVGDDIKVRQANLKVVGIFSSGGGIAEMEVWLDRKVLAGLMAGPAAPGAGEPAIFSSSLWVRLTGTSGLRELNDSLSADKSGEVAKSRVHAVSERQFLSQQSEDIVSRTTKAALAVGLVMGIGALFGAINTMYAAVAARSREIATLRAVGFQRLPIAVSIMCEGLSLSLVGALLGTAIALAVLSQLTLYIYNEGSQANIVVHFLPTTGSMAWAVGYVVLLGLLSSVLPCVRALRAPIPQGLFAS
jgi:putative ABC transport system permease protein